MSSTSIPKALSLGEETLAVHLTLNGIAFEREYRFVPARKFRADFAIVPMKLLIEVEGGHWQNGRHNRASSFETEIRKYNLAAMDEWLVMRFTTGMVVSGEAITQIKKALGMQ